MYLYAHLNEANVCVIESEGETPIAMRNAVRVDAPGHVGMRWTGSGWSSEVVRPPTQAAVRKARTALANAGLSDAQISALLTTGKAP